MTFPQLAVRLAGGFAEVVSEEALQLAVRVALPAVELGDLEAIRHLPGTPAALATTLNKAWLAGISLSERTADHPRIAALARLDAAVRAALPRGLLAPLSLVDAALARLGYAEVLLGDVDVRGVADLEPCWQRLLTALASVTLIRWSSGSREVPHWVLEAGVLAVQSSPTAPIFSIVSAADAAHEAIEALRWVRALLASGQATADQIAIASASTAPYDDHFLALRAEAGLDLHFVHGLPAIGAREGQQAAALADVLVNGLTKARLRRLVRACGSTQGVFGALPAGWLRVLPERVALWGADSWRQALNHISAADWPDGADHGYALREVVELLLAGPSGAEEAGERVLHGRALALWRRALLAGPPGALIASLATLRLDDSGDPCAAACWMKASALAGSPRPFVRLLGLNAGLWPRASNEDPLLPGHVVSADELAPYEMAARDRDDFASILKASASCVVLSHSRRDGQGRHIAGSPLLLPFPKPQRLERHAVPSHAFSESDRLLANPAEFRDGLRAVAAATCWRNWLSADATPHDGAISAGHPALHHVAARTQSANSLRKLLRYPLAYLWEYGLGWRASEDVAPALVLDQRRVGLLVHRILEAAVHAQLGSGSADAAASVAAALPGVIVQWERTEPVPPVLVWRRTVQKAAALAIRTLTLLGTEDGANTYAEVPFGGRLQEGVLSPWSSETPIAIPGTSFVIQGSIDRLDVSRDGLRAQLRDYKTGAPLRDGAVLDGGRELQRSLYTCAVRALLGERVAVRASLLYLHDGIDRELVTPDDALAALGVHLRAAHDNLLAGGTLIGPDGAGPYDDFRLLLPALAGPIYCARKRAAVERALGQAAQVWEAE